QSVTERLAAGQDEVSFSYANLAFSNDGMGPLFNAVRAVFDPAKITHPEWDERLWVGETKQADWLWDKPPAATAFPEPDRAAAFEAIKRRFFFEHVHGGELLKLVPTDEQDFTKILLTGPEREAALVRDLVLALNRFYEPDCAEDLKDRLDLWQSHRYDV